MGHKLIALLVNVVLSAKGNRVEDFFCSLVDDRTLLSTERFSICIGFDEVLIDFWTDGFQKIAKMTKYGKIRFNSMTSLKNVAKSKKVKWNKKDKRKKARGPYSIEHSIEKSHNN